MILLFPLDSRSTSFLPCLNLASASPWTLPLNYADLFQDAEPRVSRGQRRSEYPACSRGACHPPPPMGSSPLPPGWASCKGDSRLVPGSLCSQRCEPELPRSMGGRLAASRLAHGVRAQVWDQPWAGFPALFRPQPHTPCWALTSPDHLLPSFFPWPPAQPREGGPGCRSLDSTARGDRDCIFPSLHPTHQGTTEPQFPHLDNVGRGHPGLNGRNCREPPVATHNGCEPPTLSLPQFPHLYGEGAEKLACVIESSKTGAPQGKGWGGTWTGYPSPHLAL